MAKDVQVILLCDPCDQTNLTGIKAVSTHLISIDGMPPMEVDMCARDEAFFMRVYASGRALPPPPPEPKAPAQKKPKAPKAKELEKATEKTAEKPAKKAVEKAATEDKPRLLCPLGHSSKNGAPMMVTYASRNTHASVLHKVPVWEIAWEDPEGILKAFCDASEMCIQNKVGYTSKQGLTQHIVSVHRPPAALDEE